MTAITPVLAPIPKTRAMVEVFGRAGTGKTTFALTFPEPILLFAADQGAGQLWRSNVDLGVETTKSASAILARLDELASADQLPATIVIDGLTMVYNALVDRYPEDTYKTEVNREFREFVERLTAFPCNLVFTVGEKDEYAACGQHIQLDDGQIYIVKPTDSTKTGVRPDVHSLVEHLVDFVVNLTGSEQVSRQAQIVKQRGSVLSTTTFDRLTGDILLRAIAVPEMTEIRALAKALRAQLPPDRSFNTIADYAKSKGIALPEVGKSSPRARLRVRDALLADLATEAAAPTNQETVLPASPTMTDSIADQAADGANAQGSPATTEAAPGARALHEGKYGQPVHLRVAHAAVAAV